ncbi:MAG: PAS domain-containing protein [bacterium]|nr:PAS domain-containing protein [bacterium]
MRAYKHFVVYLIGVHLIFAVTIAALLWDQRLWLPVVELCSVFSLLIALRIVRRVSEPSRLIESGVELIRGGDFTTRFEPQGKPGLDDLIGVYNQMVNTLHEERVRNEEQDSFLRRIMGVSPQGIITLDFDGRVTEINPSAETLLGVPASEVRGRQLSDLDNVLALELAELGPEETSVLNWKSGRMYRCQKGSFFDSGFPRAFYQVQELTEELRRSEKSAYDKLIRMMAHEVNNTTGSVNSLLRSCLNYRRQIADTERDDFVQALEVAIRRSENMNRFMKRFADVVRIPAPTRQSTDMGVLIESILQLVKAEADRRNIAIRSEIYVGDPMLDLDPVLLEQALVNIVRNALEAVEQDGSVTVRFRRSGKDLILEVIDTGTGLTPETRARLFTPFFTTKRDGQGIGLTMVREILENHGYSYELDGPLGGPTCFTIFFDAH